MLNKISKIVIIGLVNKKIVECDKWEIYFYGINLLLTGCIDFISMMLIGILFNEVIECLVFILMFIPLRQYTGGCHASTPIKCYISTLLMITIVLSVIGNVNFSFSVLSGLFILSGVIIWILSPVAAKNKPLDDMEKRIYKKKAVSIWGIELIAAIICIIIRTENLSECIMMAHAVIAVALVVGKVTERK